MVDSLHLVFEKFFNALLLKDMGYFRREVQVRSVGGFYPRQEPVIDIGGPEFRVVLDVVYKFREFHR